MDGKGVINKYIIYKTFYWQDGRKYEGLYKDDKKEGYGEF